MPLFDPNPNRTSVAPLFKEALDSIGIDPKIISPGRIQVFGVEVFAALADAHKCLREDCVDFLTGLGWKQGVAKGRLEKKEEKLNQDLACWRFVLDKKAFRVGIPKQRDNDSEGFPHKLPSFFVAAMTGLKEMGVAIDQSFDIVRDANSAHVWIPYSTGKSEGFYRFNLGGILPRIPQTVLHVCFEASAVLKGYGNVRITDSIVYFKEVASANTPEGLVKLARDTFSHPILVREINRRLQAGQDFRLSKDSSWSHTYYALTSGRCKLLKEHQRFQSLVRRQQIHEEARVDSHEAASKWAEALAKYPEIAKESARRRFAYCYHLFQEARATYWNKAKIACHKKSLPAQMISFPLPERYQFKLKDSASKGDKSACLTATKHFSKIYNDLLRELAYYKAIVGEDAPCEFVYVGPLRPTYSLSSDPQAFSYAIYS